MNLAPSLYNILNKKLLAIFPIFAAAGCKFQYSRNLLQWDKCHCRSISPCGKSDLISFCCNPVLFPCRC